MIAEFRPRFLHISKLNLIFSQVLVELSSRIIDSKGTH